MSKRHHSQQEIVIDIHLKTLRMNVDKETRLRVVWSRGKKQAKSQVKKLEPNMQIAVFDEKFQINTVLELDEETQLPSKPKLSYMTVQLDRDNNSMPIGEIEFDMTDFKYGEYKFRTFKLVRSAANKDVDFDPEETYLEIGLKGTKQDGLVQKRMTEIKKQMDSSIKDILKSSMKGPNGDSLMGPNVQSEELFQNIVQIEVDKLKRDAKEKMKEYEEKLQKKNKVINDLLTESENIKTEKFNLESTVKQKEQGLEKTQM